MYSRKIVKVLEKNSNQTAYFVSKKINAPKTTVRANMDRLVKQKVVKRRKTKKGKRIIYLHRVV